MPGKKASKATPKTQSWAPVYSASQAAATAAVARLDCSAAARGAAPQPVAADYLTTCDPATDAAVVLSPAVLVSTDIASARAASSTAGWSVDLGLDQAGTAAFSALTQHLAASHGRFAFVVDGVVLDSRNPTATVTDGAAQFGGALTELQAKALADALTTGPLPVSFDAISVQGISIDNVPASS